MSRFFAICLSSIIVTAVALAGNYAGNGPLILDNSGTIRGVVYSDQGQPQEAAKVIFYSTQKIAVETTLTDINGQFAQDLAAGSYYVSAEAFNYSKQLYSKAYEFDKAMKISLSASRIIDLEFHLKAGGMIVGEIYAGDNEIDDFLVTAIKADLPHAGWRCDRIITIGNHGSYSLDGLLPGYYRVSVRGNGFQTQYYQQAETYEDADLLDIQVGDLLGDIDFSMEQPGSGVITGRLMDSGSGDPISDAEIWACQSTDGGYDPNKVMVRSDEAGCFTIEVTAGYYYVKGIIGGLGLGNIITIYYDNQTDPKLAETIKVDADDSVSNIALSVDLSRCYNLTLTGAINEPETGYPIDGAKLMALDRSTGRPIAYGISRENGEFAINYLYSGTYIIEIGGRQIIPGFWPDVLTWQDAETIVLTNAGQNLYNGGAITQDYGTPGFSISGHVADENGPLADTRIYAVNEGNQKVAYARSNLSGYYNISSGLFEGNYQLFADLYGFDAEYYPTTLYLDLVESPTYEGIDFVMTPDIVSVAEKPNQLPRDIRLIGNYPNPFNSRTLIYFSADHAVTSVLRIFNTGGQLVRVMPVDIVPGINAIAWDGISSTGQTISSGLYFYKIDAAPESKKMLLIK